MSTLEDWLETCRVAIKNRPHSESKTYALLVRNKQILCISKDKCEKLDNHLAVCTSYRLECGFTSAEWQQIKQKIACFIKGGLL
ncbi:hypothetical protein LCGC14_1113930 [marine sediment metagenome]|uniref:Uncharacterized protein n=1 Tax=marine sediment metagenome TaxID=412755 RepID=A0A0F9M611_9ZZZZ